MKFIWEASDIGNPPGRLAMRGDAEIGDIVMVNTHGLTSLRDGKHWADSFDPDGIAICLNRSNYVPVTDPVNAFAVITHRPKRNPGGHSDG